VLQAYGWADLGLAPQDEAARAAWTDALLHRLVDLNTRRAAEEAQGTVRWLRPEFQNPDVAVAASGSATQPGSSTLAPMFEQTDMDLSNDTTDSDTDTQADPTTGTGQDAARLTVVAQLAWPATLPEQIKAVAQVLSNAATPLDMEAIAAHFKARGRWRDRLPIILETLVALGRAQTRGENQWQGIV
jgi:hypothetical protein